MCEDLIFARTKQFSQHIVERTHFDNLQVIFPVRGQTSCASTSLMRRIFWAFCFWTLVSLLTSISAVQNTLFPSSSHSWYAPLLLYQFCNAFEVVENRVRVTGSSNKNFCSITRKMYVKSSMNRFEVVPLIFWNCPNLDCVSHYFGTIWKTGNTNEIFGMA